MSMLILAITELLCAQKVIQRHILTISKQTHFRRNKRNHTQQKHQTNIREYKHTI